MIATIEIHCDTAAKPNAWWLMLQTKTSNNITAIPTDLAIKMMQQLQLEPMHNNHPTIIKYA